MSSSQSLRVNVSGSSKSGCGSDTGAHDREEGFTADVAMQLDSDNVLFRLWDGMVTEVDAVVAYYVARALKFIHDFDWQMFLAADVATDQGNSDGSFRDSVF
ncbi:hypothetical protein NKR23_g4872 [Pleurostoma richardsiae]|uniref:Uncharacterized protein n=1 Tax=Pleurostoma richardsiae TaxID=41990 RepID=A0AA38RUD9_9PEZI|nr:hypothetical protein NKR23_g4872 [Pleurostoma richardsiae]